MERQFEHELHDHEENRGALNRLQKREPSDDELKCLLDKKELIIR